jgi:hypothetical protein
MSTSCPALARRRGLQGTRLGLIGAAESGARGRVADGIPIAVSSNGRPSCRHDRTMDRSCSTEAPGVQVASRCFLCSIETMNELLNKIK